MIQISAWYMPIVLGAENTILCDQMAVDKVMMICLKYSYLYNFEQVS